MKRPSRELRLVVVTLEFIFATMVAAAVLLRAFSQPLDHDEHQFVASAALIARDGLVPYRDFPYFHLPYLSYLFAALFLVFDHLLLAARTLSAIAALGVVAVTWAYTRDSFREYGHGLASLLAALFALALVTNPLYFYAAGRAWNHDVAILFALLATFRSSTAAESKRPILAMALGGLLLGVAIGIRSTMATLVPAFAVALWISRRNAPAGVLVRDLVALLAGMGVGLLPVGVLFLLAPEQFVHGNLGYNLTLNTLYRARLGHEVAMTMPDKWTYLTAVVLGNPRATALIGAYAATGICAALTRKSDVNTAVASTIALCLPALFWAALTPTPTWYQYYYATQVFLLTGVVANFALTSSWGRMLAAFAVAPMLLGGVTGARYSWPITRALPAAEWTVHVVHDAGLRIAEQRPNGRVLTLGPIYPLEGKVEIYPELATGPFQWRTAAFVAEEDRLRLGILGPAELASLTEDTTLAGILTGVEADPVENLEGVLVEFVAARNWEPIDIDDHLVLWKPHSVGNQPPSEGENRLP